MEIALPLAQRVATSIELGESSFREFKSAWQGPVSRKLPRPYREIRKDIAEGLVCFANADGGDFIVGVEDDGTVSGVPHPDAEIDAMLKAPDELLFQGQTLPIQYKGLVAIGEVKVLYFSVAKGTTQIFQLADGRCMRRRDRVCAPVDFGAIQFERQEVRSREYERQFVDGATVSDLDMEELQIAANSLFAGSSIERYLQQLQLAEFVPGGLRLRMAALLLFAKDVRRWPIRSQIRFLRVNGTEVLTGPNYNVTVDTFEEGNIFKLFTSGWERLRTFLVTQTTLSAEARFESTLIFPETACQEALVNALAHRDYSIQNPVEIYVYDDRMEIRSPGALLSTIRVEDLTELIGAHESRNALVARVLREHRVMRELGEGMRRIFEAMDAKDFTKPLLRSNGTSFSVALFNKSLFSEEQRRYLEQFQSSALSRLQKRIVAAGMHGRELSPDEIYRSMNTEDRDTYDKEVTGLRNLGVLQEIRTNVQAAQRARTAKIDKRLVPRFRVVAPATATRPAGSPPPKYPAGELFPEGTGIFVAGAPVDVSKAELESLFAQFGEVRKVLVNRGRHAIVWLDSETAVNNALEKLDGLRIRNHALMLRKFRAKDRDPSLPNSPKPAR